MKQRQTKKLVFILILMGTNATAAPFADPTRPPSFTAPSEAAPSGRPRLESVLIGPDRRIAVIDGQRVQLGERFRGGQVVSISESEVVIRSGQASETLRLFPQVEKQNRTSR
jgi:MSHA biogenesis protein MshK